MITLLKRLLKRLHLTKYRSFLRYGAFRWIMPSLGHVQMFHMNLAQKAWPRVSALTANRTYTDQIESIEVE